MLLPLLFSAAPAHYRILQSWSTQLKRDLGHDIEIELERQRTGTNTN
jgi:hypothetical protein